MASDRMTRGEEAIWAAVFARRLDEGPQRAALFASEAVDKARKAYAVLVEQVEPGTHGWQVVVPRLAQMVGED